MGKIRTRKVKVLAGEILEDYPDLVKPDFESNKVLVGRVLRGAVSKKLRNKVAGYLTTLLKRQQKQIAGQQEASEEVNA
ncbi:MAG: 30S ribosomal protein S17e [Nitrososphaerota archaeon]